MTLLIVHVIAAEAIKENGEKQILETIWFMNVDYHVCSNVTYAIGHSNTNAPLSHIWDVNTKLLLEKIINCNDVKDKTVYKLTMYHIICLIFNTIYLYAFYESTKIKLLMLLL